MQTNVADYCFIFFKKIMITHCYTFDVKSPFVSENSYRWLTIMTQRVH